MSDHIAEDLLLRAATLDDAEGVTALLNTCAREAFGADDTMIEELRHDWQFPGFDVAADTMVAFDAEGSAIGYAAVWNRLEPYVRSYTHFALHPEYAGHPLGHQLLDWAEATARAKIAKVPPDARVTLHASALDSQQYMLRYFQEAGFTLNRHVLMMKIAMDEAPPSPVFPDGVVVTTYADFPQLEAIARTAEDAFKDHHGFVEHSFEDIIREWQQLIVELERLDNFDATLWFIALEAATREVVGLSLCMPRMTEDTAMAYLDTLCVSRDWRQQGVGLALMHYTFGEFYRRGTRKVALHVDAASLTGATRLYEKAGMHVERRFDSYLKILRDGEDLSTQALD